MTDTTATQPAGHRTTRTYLPIQASPNHAVRCVESFTPTAPDLAATQRAFIQFIGKNPQTFASRHAANGHFTVAAVLLSPTRKHFALFSSDRDLSFRLPGGHIEARDTSFSGAARRELVNKTGIVPKETRQLLTAPLYLFAEQEPAGTHLHAVVTYLFASETTRLEPRGKAYTAIWASPFEAERLMGRHAAPVMPLLAALQEKLTA